MWRHAVTGRIGRVVLLAGLLAAPLAGVDVAMTARAASAAVHVNHFTDPSIANPDAITAGPDGALWFTDIGNNSIGRIDPNTHGITYYTDPSIANPNAIATGPDGALWFTNFDNDTIGRIDAGTQAITNYPSVGTAPDGIAAGADGAIWFTNWASSSIGRIDPSTHVVTIYPDSAGVDPGEMTAGPDGALWFVDVNNNSIGRVTTAGVVTNYTGTGVVTPIDITAGSDNALWFTNLNNTIGRIDASTHAVTTFTDPNIAGPRDITAGPDGALWFVNLGSNTIERISTDGTATTYPDVSIDGPEAITTGADGALWFTNSTGASIGRITPPGAIDNFTDPSINDPTGMTAGPDGAMWFTNASSIGRIDPLTGVVTNFTGLGIQAAKAITTGPDGALWFTNAGNNSIGRIDPTTHVVTNYAATSGVFPSSITTGPDGALWFTNRNNNSIGRIDPTTHVVTNYPLSSTFIFSNPTGITSAAGALWFTNQGGTDSIGRIDPVTHALNKFTGATISGATDITLGPDGGVWFTNQNNSSIGRIDPSTHVVTNYTGPGLSIPAGITVGPDGALWFVSNGSPGSVGRIDPTTHVVTNFADAGVSGAVEIAAGPDGALWFTNEPLNSIGRVGQAFVPNATPPVSASITAGNDAVWTVAIHNPNSTEMSNVKVTLHASANGSTPLGFDGAHMPNCAPGAGNSEVCTLGNIPARSIRQFNAFVTTNGLATNTLVTGDVDVSASSRPDTFGTLGTVTIVSCGTACEKGVVAPSVPLSSPAPTTAIPTQQVVTLPTNVQTAPAIAITLQSVNPGAAPAADHQLCPVTGPQTRCSGQISVVNGNFTPYKDRVHPVSVKVVAKWPGALPPGRLLMLKPAGGAPVQLPGCVVNGFTHQYNTPCLKSEVVTGTASTHTVVSTDTVFFVGTDPHFSRRLVTTPDAPTALTATVGPTSATVHWTAPVVTNGAVTGYVVTPYVGTVAQKAVSFAGTARSGTITGLTVGKTYTFKALAKNVHGNGYLSIASPARVIGAPNAPTGVSVSAGGVAAVTIHWATPAAAATNGAPITGYVITPLKSGVAQPAKSFAVTATTETITGLAPGSYTFRVAARNSRGLGAYTLSPAITTTTG